MDPRKHESWPGCSLPGAYLDYETPGATWLVIPRFPLPRPWAGSTEMRIQIPQGYPSVAPEGFWLRKTEEFPRGRKPVKSIVRGDSLYVSLVLYPWSESDGLELFLHHVRRRLADPGNMDLCCIDLMLTSRRRNSSSSG